MTDCESLAERMPTVAHGQEVWAPEELEHLASCLDCEEEWRLVQAGVGLAHNVRIDTARISAGLQTRIADGVAVRPIRRRLSVHRVAIGLFAAAAAVVLLVRTDVRPRSGTSNGLPPAAVAIVIPELDNLSEQQLERVLSDVDLAGDRISPMRLPRLGDLSEQELEQMLHDMGG